MKLRNTNSPKTTIIVTAVLLLALNTFAFAASGTWSTTGSMLSARDGHTATLLANGRVLVAGGTNNGVALTSAELYNRTTGTWASTGSMHVGRALARAVLSSNGKVLVVGGCINDCLSTTKNSAQIVGKCLLCHWGAKFWYAQLLRGVPRFDASGPVTSCQSKF